MAKDLLDPTAKDDTSDNINPERNVGQQDYDDKFNTITNTPENQAFGDQANASAQGGFKYSPDPDRQDLAEKEQGGGNAVSNAESDESSRLGDDDSLYKPDAAEGVSKKSRIKGFLSSKKTQGGLLGGGVIGLLLGGFMGLQPFQLLHLSRLLDNLHYSRQNTAQDMSTRRTYNALSGQRQFSQLGLMGQALAQKQTGRLLAEGIELDYQTDRGRNRSVLQGITVHTRGVPTAKQSRLLEQAESIMPDGNITRRADGTVRINTRDLGNVRDVRALAGTIAELDGKKGIAGALAKRRLIKLFGVSFSPMNLTKRGVESLTDYIRNRRAERSESIKDGVRTGDLPGDSSDSDKPGSEGRFSRLRSNPAVRVGGGAAAVVTVFCAVRELGNAVQDYKMMNVIQPLIIMGWDVMSVASQIQNGDNITADEVAAFSSALYNEETQTSWAAAKPFVTARGGDQNEGIELDGSVKDQVSTAYTGEKAEIFKIADGGGVVASSACAVDSAIQGAIAPVTDRVTKYLIDPGLRFLTNKSSEEWMGEVVGLLAGEAINTLAEGSEYGNLISYGNRLAANATASGIGGVPLTSAEVAEWNKFEQETKIAEKKQQNIFTRLFSPSSIDSVTSIALFESTPAMGRQALTHSIRKQPLFAFNSAPSVIGTALSAPVHAQRLNVNAYDYAGIPEVGFPLGVLNNDRYEDIYENIERLEANNYRMLRDANDKWGKCFGYPLDENDPSKIADKSTSDESNLYGEILDGDCVSSRNQQDFQDFQMYILDNVTIKSLACYEGIDESACSEIGFGGATPSGNQPTPGQTGPLPEGEVSEADTVHVPSCGGSGWSVHRSIEQNVDAMCRQAASDGTPLTIGNSWRSSARQIELRKSNCGGTSHYVIYEMPSSACRPPTAPPGRSNHQRGLAIDFASCSTRSTACYRWLAANAERFGFYNLPSEPWHWSVDGG